MSKFCLISLELLSRGMFDFSNAMEKYISSNSFKLNKALNIGLSQQAEYFLSLFRIILKSFIFSNVCITELM